MTSAKRRRLVVLPRAREDIVAVTDRIEIESAPAARNLAEEFAVRLETLTVSVGSLRMRPEFGPDIRVALFKPWMIFFRASDDEIVILRVLHGAMHPRRIRAATRER